MNDSTDTPSHEDFEVEISDLEPDNRISHFVASMGAFRSRLFMEDVRKDNDFELEISDLPPDEGSLYRIANALKTFGSHVPFKRRLWRVACSGMILVLLVLLLGYVPRDMALRLFAQPTSMSNSVPGSPSLSSSSSSSIVSASVDDTPGGSSGNWVSSWTPQSGISRRYADSPPLVADNAVLGPVPENCPSGPTPRNFDPDFPPGVGEAPLWVTGFTGPHAELTHLTRANQPQLGWYSQILLALQASYRGPVGLLGENMQDGSSLWFGDPATQYSPRKTIITLHPEDPSISNHFSPDEQWVAWSVYVYIPAAGCYYLVAVWGEEHWVVKFAAGWSAEDGVSRGFVSNWAK